MNTGKSGYDHNQVKELCEKHNLKLLILHGSRAKNLARDDSDIDVGILGRDKIDFKAYKEILNDFGGIFGDRFDPAFLNNAEPMICYQVVMHGEPLFEAHKGDFANFKVQSLGRYMDTKKFRELEKEYIKKAVGKN